MASLTKSASNRTIRDLVSKEKEASSWEMMPQVTSYAQLHEPTQTFTLNTHCWMRQKVWGDRAHLFLVEQGDRLPVLSSDGFSVHVREIHETGSRTDSGLHLSQNEVTQPWTEVYWWQNRNWLQALFSQNRLWWEIEIQREKLTWETGRGKGIQDPGDIDVMARCL